MPKPAGKLFPAEVPKRHQTVTGKELGRLRVFGKVKELGIFEGDRLVVVPVHIQYLQEDA